MKHFAAASGCDNCYPVNVALTFAVKHVMEKFMLEISCLFFGWDAFLLSPSTLLSHCSPMCPIKYLRAGGQSAAVQVRGPSLSASLRSPLLSFKLWRRSPGSMSWNAVKCDSWPRQQLSFSNVSIEPSISLRQRYGQRHLDPWSLTNSGAFVSGKASRTLWWLRTVRNGTWILRISGEACSRRPCHLLDAFVGSRN